jgi:Membrane domain of glycerophosphoryl diester phosphodiesterase
MLKRLYPPRRPQSVGEVLDTGFSIFAASLLKTLPYAVLMILVGQLVNIYNLATGHPLQSRVHDVRSGVMLLLGYIIQAPIGAAMMLRQRAIAQAEPDSMRAQLGHALRIVPQILAIGPILGLAFAVGFVLLVVPGLYLLVALSLAMPALILEGKSLIDALKYSLHLTRGHWWHTAGVYTITLVITIVFYFLGAVLVAASVQFMRGADVALTTAAARVLMIALAAVSFPYFTATALAMLGDLKVRDAAAAAGHAEN